MSNRDVAIRFLERFSAGDIDGLVSLLAQDLRFEGPIHQCGSAQDYLSRLREDPPGRSVVDIISTMEGDDSVAIFYQYRKPDAVTTVGQLFGFESGRISRMLVVFDGRGVA